MKRAHDRNWGWGRGGGGNHSLFEEKLAAEASLCLYKMEDNRLLFKTMDSHWGWRGICHPPS